MGDNYDGLARGGAGEGRGVAAQRPRERALHDALKGGVALAGCPRIGAKCDEAPAASAKRATGDADGGVGRVDNARGAVAVVDGEEGEGRGRLRDAAEAHGVSPGLPRDRRGAFEYGVLDRARSCGDEVDLGADGGAKLGG